MKECKDGLGRVPKWKTLVTILQCPENGLRKFENLIMTISRALGTNIKVFSRSFKNIFLPTVMKNHVQYIYSQNSIFWNIHSYEIIKNFSRTWATWATKYQNNMIQNLGTWVQDREET